MTFAVEKANKKKKKYLVTYGVIFACTYLLWLSCAILSGTWMETLLGPETGIMPWLFLPAFPILMVMHFLGFTHSTPYMWFLFVFGAAFYFLTGTVTARIVLWLKERKSRRVRT